MYIWTNSSEMGHNWVIFSDRGANLMDAIQSPVNTAGSICIFKS